MRQPRKDPDPRFRLGAFHSTLLFEPTARRRHPAICPHCRKAVNGYRFVTDGDLSVTTYHCVEHGDVIPRQADSARRDPFPLHA